jgi:branched-chain amino acid transport system substrate-binding protein
MIIMVLGLLLFSPSASAAGKTLYIGGSFSLTGPYAADTAPALSCFEGYAKYVNENKILAPWYPYKKFPADITLEVLWRDDELKPAKALSIYEELKAKGMLVYTVTGSPIALALMDRLNEHRIGATSMTSAPFLLSPPKTTFTVTAIYTDALAAVADWFKANWKENRKPRVAYLTADNAMGKSIEIPELKAYLEKIGYEVVGSQYVPLMPTAPPTTQLSWLKKNKVDLTLGVMIHPGVEATMKESVRLNMGPHLGYKITFGFAYPAHLHYCWSDLGELAEGLVVAGDFPTWDELLPGVKFVHELLEKYHLNDRVSSNVVGLAKVMIQVEALRLALEKVPFDRLKPVDVLEYGFYRIKDFDTGGLTSTPVTYGPGNVEGIEAVRVDQVQKGKVVKLGVWPCRHLYKH